MTSPSGSTEGGTTTFAPAAAARATVPSTSSTSTNSCTKLGASGGAGQTPPSMPRALPEDSSR
jgi:hypothetical protein